MLVHPDMPFRDAVDRHRQHLEAAAFDGDRGPAPSLVRIVRGRLSGRGASARPRGRFPTGGVRPARP